MFFDKIKFKILFYAFFFSINFDEKRVDGKSDEIKSVFDVEAVSVYKPA